MPHLSRNRGRGARRSVIFFLLTIAFGALPAVGQAEDATRCDFRAFATDRDHGTNIRRAPDREAAIIGHLPPQLHLGHGEYVGAEFEVIGSRAGWLLIRNAAASRDAKRDPTLTFAGPGWIWGGRAGATLGDPVLRAAPRRDAAVVARLVDTERGWGPDSFLVTRIHGCDGAFVDVTATRGRERRVHGWSLRPCVAQLTTCDWSSQE